MALNRLAILAIPRSYDVPATTALLEDALKVAPAETGWNLAQRSTVGSQPDAAPHHTGGTGTRGGLRGVPGGPDARPRVPVRWKTIVVTHLCAGGEGDFTASSRSHHAGCFTVRIKVVDEQRPRERGKDPE